MKRTRFFCRRVCTAVVFVSVCSSLPAAPGSGGERRYAGVSGNWADGRIWGGGVPPAEKERIWIQPAADKGPLTVTFGGDVATAFFQLNISPNLGTVLTLDGAGHDFAPTNALSETYAATSLSVFPNWTGNTAVFFSLERANAFLDRPFRLGDPLVRASAGEEGLARLEFLRGDVNFYDPDGEGTGSTERTLHVGAGGNAAGSETVFSNVTVRLGKLDYPANDPVNRLRFADADVTVFGEITSSNGSRKDARVSELVFSDGSDVTLKKGLSYYAMENYYPTRAVYRPDRLIAVRSGTVVKHEAGLVLVTAPLTRFEISGGSLFDSSSSAGAFNVANGDYHQYASNCVFTVSDSVWKTSPYGTALGSSATPTPLVVAITNSTVVLGTHLFIRNAACDFSGTNAVSCGSARLEISAGSTVAWRGGRITGAEVRVGTDTATSESVLALSGGRIGVTALCGRGSHAVLTADGGTVAAPAGAASRTLLSGFARAALGPAGLTLDTAGVDTTVAQDFSDTAGGKGLFVKAGQGTLTLDCAAYAVATTRVDQGTLAFADAAAAAALRTTLELDGGTLSLAGEASAMTLSGFSAAAGKIELDPGDTIAVDGAFSVATLELAFTSDPARDAVVDCLSVAGEPDEALLAALRRIVVANRYDDGTYIRFSPVYDAGSGRTVVTAARVAEAGPIGQDATTVYRAGAWTEASSWSAGVPDAAKLAAFPDGAAVTVADGAVAGAISFAGSAALSGGSLEIAAEQGAAAIASAGEGEVSIAAPLLFGNYVDCLCATGSVVQLDGGIDGGGIRKKGSGELVLGAENGFDLPVEIGGGRLVAAQVGALGPHAPILVSGTLSLDADAAALPGLAVRAPDNAASVVLDVRRDAVLSSVDTASGAIIKRGAGTLTLDLTGRTEDCTLSAKSLGAVKAVNLGAGTWSLPVSFPGDGSSPTSGYAAVTVAEGELRIKGEPGGATCRAGGTLLVGIPVDTCAVQPTLTIDGAYFDANDGLPSGVHGAFVGVAAGLGSSAVTNPVLRVLNGGVFHCNTIRVGFGFRSDAAAVTVAGTNATFIGGYESRLAEESAVGRTVWRLEDSSLLAGYAGVYPVYIVGRIDFDGANTVIESNGHAPCGVRLGAHSCGRVYLHDGGLCRINGFTGGKNQEDDLVFVFDGAEWRPVGSGDFAFVRDPDQNPRVRVEMAGDGVILAPSAGATYSVAIPFEGAGGLVITNAGTVAFAEGAYAFTGVCDVRSGTLDLSAAGELDGAAFSGAGTVRGGTLRNAELSSAADPSAVPLFDDCTFDGTVTVDFGLAADHVWETPYPTGIPVARAGGTTVFDPASFRLVNGGADVKGSFSVVDGTVRMDIVRRDGFMLLVR